MINFENTLMEGLSISGKISTKKPRVKGSIKTSKRGGWGTPKPTLKAGSSPLSLIKKAAVSSAAKVATAHPRIVSAAIKKAAIKAPLLNRPDIAKAALVGVMAKRLVSPTAAIARPTITPLLARGAVKGRIALNRKGVPALATRQKAAANIVTKAALALAVKPAHLKKQSPEKTKEKAHKAIAPIAQACGCQTAPVLIRVKRKMSRHGYPHSSVESLLAQLHDMNAALSKAALQRLATYEHNSLVQKHSFEHEVLSRLADLSHQLPEGHPTRTKANLNILKRC